MIENTAPHAEEEEISIEITDEPVEGQGSDESEDELDRYTKSVSKRINKLNRKNREAEARAQQLEQLAHQKEQELAQYRQYAANQQQSVLASEEQKLAAQESQVNDIYQRAVSSNDADLMSKADSLKTDIAIKKKSLKRRNRNMRPPTRSKRRRNNSQSPIKLISRRPRLRIKVLPKSKSSQLKRLWGGIKKTSGLVIRTTLIIGRPRSLRITFTTT